MLKRTNEKLLYEETAFCSLSNKRTQNEFETCFFEPVWVTVIIEINQNPVHWN